MRAIILKSWALLLGIFMLMIGNGLQATLLGVRGGAEGFSGAVLGYVMAGYFVGFLGGTWVTPRLLRRVGHVRVFAAFGSLISAAFILYATLVEPVTWFLLRVVVGLCFSGVYIVSESWLNDAATNETRGKTMAAYITAQMMGIILAQLLLNVADPGGYPLFVLMSVLVSLSFLPILLSAGPAPKFEQTRPMSLRQLYQTSPLGCVAIFALGAIFAVQFGMSAVYAAERGFSLFEISIFVAMIYAGGLVWQPPIGWLSDRMHRRVLIMDLTGVGALGCLIVPVLGPSFPAILVAAFIMGGASNSLYSLVVAYVNDYLESEDMAAASAGLIMLNGIGAMGAPILLGYLMDLMVDDVFFLFLAAAFASITLYAIWRQRQRPVRIVIGEQGPVVPMSQVASPLAADVAIEAALEQVQEGFTEPKQQMRDGDERGGDTAALADQGTGQDLGQGTERIDG
ncbi:MAG TPA: MFS transporter [Paracoccaceae bacterium]|nr:MFS transporter [Paracoccaceae bacterium]